MPGAGSSRTHLLRAAIVVALAMAAIAPAGASAAFHLMKVSEVYPGTTAAPDSAFIEIQAYQAGQNLLAGHAFKTYDASGTVTGTFTIAANVPNAQTQRTALFADSAPPGGVMADGTFGDLDGKLNPSGGAVCFETIDCVAWGNFSGQGSLPSPAGPPIAAAGIPDGAAISRSISPGCATLLEDADDTNVSAADFGISANPSPRPNSVSPPEQACSGGSGAPATVIDRGPNKKTTKTKATFEFSSPDAGAEFECSLDGKAFKPCSSAQTYKGLKPGKHTFKVRAVVVGGSEDPSPAKYSWKVKKKG